MKSSFKDLDMRILKMKTVHNLDERFLRYLRYLSSHIFLSHLSSLIPLCFSLRQVTSRETTFGNYSSTTLRQVFRVESATFPSQRSAFLTISYHPSENQNYTPPSDKPNFVLGCIWIHYLKTNFKILKNEEKTCACVCGYSMFTQVFLKKNIFTSHVKKEKIMLQRDIGHFLSFFTCHMKCSLFLRFFDILICFLHVLIICSCAPRRQNTPPPLLCSATDILAQFSVASTIKVHEANIQWPGEVYTRGKYSMAWWSLYYSVFPYHCMLWTSNA
jgi:hypothetical protein